VITHLARDAMGSVLRRSSTGCGGAGQRHFSESVEWVVIEVWIAGSCRTGASLVWAAPQPQRMNGVLSAELVDLGERWLGEADPDQEFERFVVAKEVMGKPQPLQ
jgi:hypothetical protein